MKFEFFIFIIDFLIDSLEKNFLAVLLVPLFSALYTLFPLCDDCCDTACPTVPSGKTLKNIYSCSMVMKRGEFDPVDAGKLAVAGVFSGGLFFLTAYFLQRMFHKYFVSPSKAVWGRGFRGMILEISRFSCVPHFDSTINFFPVIPLYLVFPFAKFPQALQSGQVGYAGIVLWMPVTDTMQPVKIK